jgi:hypothetical protein
MSGGNTAGAFKLSDNVIDLHGVSLQQAEAMLQDQLYIIKDRLLGGTLTPNIGDK